LKILQANSDLFDLGVKIPVILGATAVGKSDAAIESAKLLGGEIISCDSRQVYKFMDIATAKPSKDELLSVKHHLIDIITPDEEYSAAKWAKDCTAAIDEIKSRGKTPIICGGTFFYIDALRNGFDVSGGQNSQLRDELLKFREKHGSEELYKLLAKKNSARAAQLHPNDTNRIIRALQIENGEKTTFAANKIEKDFEYFILSSSREKLYERINFRVDKMLTSGLFDEYREICEKYPDKNTSGRNCVGYREFDEFVAQNRSFEDAVNLIKQHSRNFAKRQFTWLRNKFEDKTIIDIEKENFNYEFVARFIGKSYIY
jgi:tRNA dimethylallyltransferase